MLPGLRLFINLFFMFINDLMISFVHFLFFTFITHCILKMVRRGPNMEVPNGLAINGGLIVFISVFLLVMFFTLIEAFEG